MKLPKRFEEKIQTILKDEYDDYIKCYEEKRLYGLRVNTAKISIPEFQKLCPFEIQPIPWIDNGFYYDGDHVQPGKHPYYYAGLYYLQEPSAMTPASRLPVEPGDKVLDVCAAPGGKATELGARLEGEGVLAANDISSSRAKGLLKNLEVFGIPNMLVLSEEPGKLTGYFNEYFDKILIDAPCSGEGMFRKDKKMIKAWEEHGPEFFSKIQRSIITQAAQMLKPGGMMLYSTCTFDPMENEGAIEYLLEEYPQFHILEIEHYKGFCHGLPEVTKTKDKMYEKTVRIWPHKMHGEGHYLALLQKGKNSTESKAVRRAVSPRKGKLPKELLEFLDMVSVEFDELRIEIHGEKVYYMPDELPELTGIRFLRTGLYMGDVKKNRFEPSQSLAMTLKEHEYKNRVNLSVEDERVMKYLKGETLEIDDLADMEAKGWYLLTVDHFPLGWGKLSAGTLKNKYLPGWRCQS